jgi:hypothetical protein
MPSAATTDYWFGTWQHTKELLLAYHIYPNKRKSTFMKIPIFTLESYYVTVLLA